MTYLEYVRKAHRLDVPFELRRTWTSWIFPNFSNFARMSFSSKDIGSKPMNKRRSDRRSISAGRIWSGLDIPGRILMPWNFSMHRYALFMLHIQFHRLHRCWWQVDVGDKWMLVTLAWWQFLDVSDRTSILVTSFGCCCPPPLLKDRGCWWQKRPKLSPTSQSCRLHISSPTSVSNIDVANGMPLFCLKIRIKNIEMSAIE